MNIFRPEENIVDSVRALDDRRLVKQILECKVLLGIATGEGKTGYARHPVAEYYKDHPRWLALYGLFCCREYDFRFNRTHAYYDIFKSYHHFAFMISEDILEHVPAFYAEGPKTDPAAIRQKGPFAEQLFRNKLIRKWNTDKQPPKWTRRGAPSWYQEWENYCVKVSEKDDEQ